MKRGAIDHPKMLMLAAELDTIRAKQPTLGAATDGLSGQLMAIGIVESLLAWCFKYAIQGNIGKWDNAVICRGIGYKWDADELIAALTRCGWLDAHRKHRLVVHDIKDHADNTWRQCLEDAGLTWYDGSDPRKYRHNASSENPERIQKHSSKSPQPKPKPKPKPKPSQSQSLPEAEAEAEPKVNQPPVPVTPEPAPPTPLATPSVSGENAVTEISASDSDNRPLDNAVFQRVTVLLPAKLGYHGGTVPRAQYAADLTCFAKIALITARGSIGPPADAEQALYAKAKHFAQCAENPVSRMIAEVKTMLAAKGLAWDTA